MPTTNKLLKDLPAFYKHQTYHGVLFGFIRCYKKLYPTVTVSEVAWAFMAEFGIKEDDLDLKAAITQYFRMNKDFLDAQKTEHTAKKRPEKATQKGQREQTG